jgi:hypothetical protein
MLRPVREWLVLLLLLVGPSIAVEFQRHTSNWAVLVRTPLFVLLVKLSCAPPGMHLAVLVQLQTCCEYTVDVSIG